MDNIIKKIEASHTHTLCYMVEILSDELVHKKFHLCSSLFNIMSKENVMKLVEKMRYKKFKVGDRIINQGERGQNFYLILNGTCSLNLEKNNIFYNIGQVSQGSIVGEIVLFKEEPYLYTVEAESDVDTLYMNKKEFLDLTSENSEFRNLLTSIVIEKLSNSRLDSERKISKYRVIEKIEQGGASIIYKGVHDVLNMPVAIKMLRHELSMDLDFLERFREEARIIAKLNHPNIMRVYDIEELYQTIFIIMEYLEGIPLKSMITSKKRLTLEQVVDITVQVCRGLEYAHSFGIIHQDINPRNIFVQSNGMVKIIDFGLAIKRGSVDNDFLFPGTIYYISPEQLKGEPVDERSDLYSLGLTVYEMLTGRKPFPGCHTKAIVDWHLNKDFLDINDINSDLPRELYNFLYKTIRKDPNDRFNNMSEAIIELQPLAERYGINFAARVCERNKVIGMFLIYKDGQQAELKNLLEEFNKMLSESGIKVKITQVDVLE